MYSTPADEHSATLRGSGPAVRQHPGPWPTPLGGADVSDDICSITGCSTTVTARGWCSKHYSRWHRHGDPFYTPPTFYERFWSNVDRCGEDECWPWTGGLTGEGYGQISRGRGVNLLAHRVMYEVEVGEIPPGATIDHVCHNRDESCDKGPECSHRRCVNPEHLDAVDTGTNTLRGRARSARNARRTHCVDGHPLSGDNLYVPSNGTRQCRTCRYERDLVYRLRQRRTDALRVALLYDVAQTAVNVVNGRCDHEPPNCDSAARVSDLREALGRLGGDK